MTTLPSFRLWVRAKPGSRRARVGGRWGDDDTLVVAVQAQAVDGRANAAIEEALASALDVPRRTVCIVRGQKGRTKIVDIDPAPARLTELVQDLLEDRGAPGD